MTTAKPKTVKLCLVETTDVHGVFFPYNFTENRPMRGSMARVSTYLKRMRQEYGDHLILLDNGDILQGQPTNYYTNFVKTDEPNIAAQVLNYLKYDAEAFGNHDVEPGHKVYDKWLRDLDCPTLGANIIDIKSGQPYVEPYAIFERDGVRIAVLGMLTPAIPNWLHPSLWSGMRFEEMVSCAKRWVKTLREKEQADFVVGMFHSGWDGGISTPEYDEDATRKVVEQVEGFDVVFYGHDHREKLFSHNGIPCLNPANNAQKVAQLTLEFQKQKGRWKVTRQKADIVDITGEDIDSDYMDHFQPVIDHVKAYIAQKIGSFKHTIRARDCFFGSAAFTDLIHRLQLDVTKSDISFTAPLTFDSDINEGPVYMSDMFKLYRFENQVYALQMTGDEVRRHLEMSYDLWVNTMTSPDDHIMLLNAESVNDNQRSGFKNYTFNFDSAAGIDYEVDVTQPNGQKVRILQMSDGRPFDPNRTYRVAMNSYRANGGGELLVRGAGIPMDSIPNRIIYMSERDLRHYLTEKIRHDGEVDAKPLNNWRFFPDEWAQPAIARDRKIIFRE